MLAAAAGRPAQHSACLSTCPVHKRRRLPSSLPHRSWLLFPSLSLPSCYMAGKFWISWHATGHTGTRETDAARQAKARSAAASQFRASSSPPHSRCTPRHTCHAMAQAWYNSNNKVIEYMGREAFPSFFFIFPSSERGRRDCLLLLLFLFLLRCHYFLLPSAFFFFFLTMLHRHMKERAHTAQPHTAMFPKTRKSMWAQFSFLSFFPRWRFSFFFFFTTTKTIILSLLFLFIIYYTYIYTYTGMLLPW